MRFIGRFLWLATTVIMVIISMIFAASNDGEVTLLMWPFEAGVKMPAWLPVLGALGVGILTGGLIVWLSTVWIRARIWRAQSTIKKLEKQIKVAESKLAKTETKTDNNGLLISSER